MMGGGGLIAAVLPVFAGDFKGWLFPSAGIFTVLSLMK